MLLNAQHVKLLLRAVPPHRRPPGLQARRRRRRALLTRDSYHLLGGGDAYDDLGAEHSDRLRPKRLKHSLVPRLRNMGYKVTLEPAA
jgi:hypothetical protein